MFESAEIEHSLSDKDYKQTVPTLRENLLEAQFNLLEKKDRSVLILVAGVEGAGKGDSINLLSAWLDSRHLEVHGFGPPSDEELKRPEYYRYCRRLPPKGKIGVFFGSWYTDPILQSASQEISQRQMEGALARICEFEQMLVAEGCILLKLWFHLSKAQQRIRLRTLSQDKTYQWRVTQRDWDLFQQYDRLVQVSARTLRETSTGYAPWHVIPGADANYRQVTIGTLLLSVLQRQVTSLPTVPPVPLEKPLDGYLLLRQLDLGQQVSRKTYEKKLEKLQGKLNLALRKKKFQSRGLALVFEGWDAAGKGGAIRRVTAALDARHYHVVSVAAPSPEELRYPYLWRFWREVPQKGQVTFFDRSWYGRVLVERVEQLCAEADWMRAYKDINELEEQWIEQGVKIIKFWLHISPEEQLKRFEERERTGYKRHKITAEDWRNRDKWPDYEHAVNDMVDRTSTEIAPWHLIEAQDKRFARIKVLQIIVDQLKAWR